jgi:lipopolysaccharide export system protein LptA
MMRTSVLLLLTLFSSVHAAELADDVLQVDADDGEFDLRESEQHLRGNVLITQGAMSIAAEEAVGKGESTDNSRWTFSRSVHLQTREADLKSNTATAAFLNGQLTEATVKGSPAVFEQRTAPADKQIRGRAGQIDYDITKGIVKLTNDVWFSYGGNEFRGDVVVYNVRDEKVVVNPVGQSNGRVNIRIRPGNGIKLDPAKVPRAGNESGA